MSWLFDGRARPGERVHTKGARSRLSLRPAPRPIWLISYLSALKYYIASFFVRWYSVLACWLESLSASRFLGLRTLFFFLFLSFNVRIYVLFLKFYGCYLRKAHFLPASVANWHFACFCVWPRTRCETADSSGYPWKNYMWKFSSQSQIGKTLLPEAEWHFEQ